MATKSSRLAKFWPCYSEGESPLMRKHLPITSCASGARHGSDDPVSTERTLLRRRQENRKYLKNTTCHILLKSVCTSVHTHTYTCPCEHTCRRKPEVTLQCSLGTSNFLALKQCLFPARNSPSCPAIPRDLRQVRGYVITRPHARPHTLLCSTFYMGSVLMLVWQALH